MEKIKVYEMEMEFELTIGIRSVNDFMNQMGFAERTYVTGPILTIKQTLPTVPTQEYIETIQETVKNHFKESNSDLEVADCVFKGYKPGKYVSLGENKHYEHWNFKKDGASLISRLLFEEATDINFYVGRAINPAHQNPDLPINFNIKMNLVEELSKCLKQMGKRIKVSYF